MRKKLEGNGLWESSRMMLPEHHKTIQKMNRELDPKTRPVLDEQEMEKINDALYRSLEEQTPVKLHFYSPFEDSIVEGVVDQLDAVKWKVRVDGIWFDLNRLMKAENPGR